MSKFGIDVSQHQGTINWNAVKGQVDFAILRLGWIGNKNNHTQDTQFERNYSECKRLGIPVGVYVYCYSSSVATARSGAEWTVQKLAGKTLELPVYIDMEDSSIASKGKQVLTNICIAFNTIIEQAGFWAGVYANTNWFNNYLDKNTIKARYTTWIAHYTSGTDKYKGEYDIWQNSSSGKINGISGKVDTNYMHRDIIGATNTGTTTPSSKYRAGSYEVNTDTLNVRASASTSSRIVTQLHRGSKQGVDYTSGSWGHLLNNAGWICLDYCKPYVIDRSRAGSYQTTARLNVREEPNTSSRIITTLNVGSRQAVDYNIGNWGHLQNNAGWICLDYCKSI